MQAEEWRQANQQQCGDLPIIADFIDAGVRRRQDAEDLKLQEREERERLERQAREAEEQRVKSQAAAAEQPAAEQLSKATITRRLLIGVSAAGEDQRSAFAGSARTLNAPGA